MPIKVNRTTRLDWDALRAKVKGGMRNATLMAIAPTASIGLVAGTTPGLRPAVLADLQPRHLVGQVPRGQPQPGRRRCRSAASGSRSASDPAQPGRHPGHRRDPGRDQGDLQDELPAVAVLVPRGRGSRPEVDRPGDQPQHVPRDARPRRHDGHLLRGMGAWRQDDVLPAHEAASHRRAVDGQGQQVRGDLGRRAQGFASVGRPSVARRSAPRRRAAPARRGFGSEVSRQVVTSNEHTDTVEDYDVPVDPMDDLQCESLPVIDAALNANE